MERTEILMRIRTVIVSVLRHENFEVHDTLTAADVDGWDSLSHMVIISEIESEFKVRFKLKELNKLKNMADLVALVQSKL